MSAAPSMMDEKYRKAVQGLKLNMDEMASYTDRVCNQLNMSAAARTAAERVYKSFVCGKKLLFFQRYGEEKRWFLRLMIRLALATDPNLIPKADQVARYYGANYAFEWVQSDITANAREEARATILSVGDSSYGGTGMAAAYAFARCHYKALKFQALGDYGKTYALGARLEASGDFNLKDDETRRELGLDKLHQRREALLGQDGASPGN
ncbi:hypothetical protein LLH03_08490 [bacterium]|nr:hypothetical protein [bacterium]